MQPRRLFGPGLFVALVTLACGPGPPSDTARPCRATVEIQGSSLELVDDPCQAIDPSCLALRFDDGSILCECLVICGPHA